ncbi:MAG TPA: T9SS type A sorting domain-containing protein [Flavipsychrobacter sp.]
MKKLMLLIGGMGAITAYGQFPDVVDSTFGNNGVAIFSPSATVNNNVGNAVITTNDGMLIAGTTDGAQDDIFVLKMDKDGNPDTSFFSTGKVVYDPQIGANDQVYHMDVQPDGKILLCGRTEGQTYTQCLVMRLNPDGTLDQTFNQKGWLTFVFIGNNNTARMVKWHDSIIYVACSSTVNNSAYIYMAALEDDGNYYSDFGLGGLEYLVVNNNDKEYFRDFEITANKEILFLGTTFDGVKTHQFVHKLDSTGKKINSFGTNGTYLYSTVNTSVALNAMDLGPDGSIYLGGFEKMGGDAAVIVKLTPSGQLDNTFASGNGKAFFNVTAKAENERFANIRYVNDTTIYLVGTYVDENTNKYALSVVYKNNGSLNTNYFGNGYEYFAAPAGYDFPTLDDIGLLSDGSIVLVGEAVDDNKGTDQVVLRKLKKYIPPTVSISKVIAGSNEVDVYPNPSNGVVRFKSDVELNNIKVVNSAGILIDETRLGAAMTYQFPAHAPTGLYYLVLNSAGKTYVEKIVLQR